MNNNMKMSFGVGLPSIIVIFVTLCLTTLGALSLMTASADYNLARKSAEYAASYYEAQSEAQEWLAQINEQLQSGKYPEELTKTFPLSDRQGLSLTVQVNGPQCEVTTQKLVSNEQWNYEEYNPQFGDIIIN